MKNTKEIKILTDSYNARRFGKPYIARLDFPTPAGTPTWGAWIGDPGYAGVLIIQAMPGEIIMTGQKDFRKPNGGYPPEYFQVQDDGSLEKLPDRAAAFAYWKARQEEEK